MFVRTALTVLLLAGGAAQVSAASGSARAAVAPAVVCPVHGCYHIKETGQGPTQVAAEKAAEELMIAAGCDLIDVAVNSFQALPGGLWADQAIGICLG